MNSIVKIESPYKKKKEKRDRTVQEVPKIRTHKNIVTAYIIVSNALSLTQQHSAIN